MGDCTLLLRHLPSSLTKEEKEDFLRHFGAVRVQLMGSRGPLKHAAFAEFPNKDVALQVMGKLHQAEVLGCRLRVEVAHPHPHHHMPTDRHHPSLNTQKEGGDDIEGKEEKGEEESEDTLDFSFLQWGLKYPRRRRLYYLYPPPSPSILANISHALAACPKLYVQVLHLMNKMDLPAPFGPVTAQPPVAPDAGAVEDYADKLQTEEMELSSTEESEMESDPDTARPAEAVPRKRKAGEGRKQRKKRARLARSLLHPAPALLTKGSSPAVPLGEVFEQTGDSGAQRKIQLRLPGSVTAPVSVGRGVGRGEEESASLLPSPLPPPPLPPVSVTDPDSSEVTEPPAPDTPQSSGFGLLTPASKMTEETEEKDEDETWGETQFISRSELRKGRLSHREMESLSIFRNYKEGEASRRLYIKNVAKQVTEEDLHWVFGRYVQWDLEEQKNMFDVRLMKEGRMKGQAFVTLATEDQAARAVRDTNAFILKGKPLVVHFARSAKQQAEESKS